MSNGNCGYGFAMNTNNKSDCNSSLSLFKACKSLHLLFTIPSIVVFCIILIAIMSFSSSFRMPGFLLLMILILKGASEIYFSQSEISQLNAHCNLIP
jgi:hypothetical protein